ncbi:uncharacterized protein LOC142334046 [Lycorma delicatula]|uniref:uncharacterized protein LOC142334046 n=1 Tax=Lycorma delicatula TaxID=130591 RepID=UPI003F51280D
MSTLLYRNAKTSVHSLACNCECTISAKCKKGFHGYKQEFRYVKVNGASIFYWFFESFKAGEDPYQLSSVPLIIIPGSPGQSASSIAVLESGPFNEYGLPRDNSSMCRDYHVLYIDAVPGTGFSEVDSGCKKCYRTNSSQVANDLVKVVLEFYKRKPHFQSVPSFIYAQSYGAQIAVKFSLLLDEAIEKQKCDSDFRGIFLISPWISPYDLIESWPEYFNVMINHALQVIILSPYDQYHVQVDVTDGKLHLVWYLEKNALIVLCAIQFPPRGILMKMTKGD